MDGFAETTSGRRRIDPEERKKIFYLYKQQHLSLARIGEILHRDKSVVSKVVKLGEDFDTALEKSMELARKAVGIIRIKGPIGKNVLAKEMGMSIDCLLITITDFFPEIAEDDDGKLFDIHTQYRKDIK